MNSSSQANLRGKTKPHFLAVGVEPNNRDASFRFWQTGQPRSCVCNLWALCRSRSIPSYSQMPGTTRGGLGVPLIWKSFPSATVSKTASNSWWWSSENLVVSFWRISVASLSVFGSNSLQIQRIMGRVLPLEPILEAAAVRQLAGSGKPAKHPHWSGKRMALPPLPPLRTGRETFASSGSSRYKAPRERSRFHDGLIPASWRWMPNLL